MRLRRSRSSSSAAAIRSRTAWSPGLARPGGNVTGFTLLVDELNPKRLELLSELVPQARVIGLLVNPNSASAAARITREVQDAARTRRMQLPILKAGTENEIDAAFATLLQLHGDGIVVS